MLNNNNTPSPSGEENSAHDGNVEPVSTSVSIVEFLQHILPSEGYYCWVALKKGVRPQQGFVKTIPELAAILRQIDGAGYDAYFACSTYKEPINRKPENVLQTKAFWLDVDYGSLGHGTPSVYQTEEEATDAVDVFCEKIGMPTPTINYTGGGIQTWWALSAPLPPDVWQKNARAFKGLAEVHGLHADPTRTADIVSIMRPPETFNRKILGHPRPVECLEITGGKIQLPNFQIPKLQNGINPHSDKSLSINKAAANIYTNHDPSYSSIAANHCAQLRRFRDTKGVISEPIWYACLGVLGHCADGDEMAQQWSSGHRTYSREETAKKTAQARSAAGPTTCEHFKSLEAADKSACAGCPFSVTSPIQLGRQTQTNNWPDPQPIRETLQPVAPFNAESMLPEVLRGWVMDEANRMPCPPDFIAAGVIVALGSLIGARCAVKPKNLDDWLIVPNLWGGVVALPSAKKSPAIGVAFKPLDRLIAKAMEKHKSDMALYEAQKTGHDAQEKKIKGNIARAAMNKSGGVEPFANELAAHHQQAPTAPKPKRYKTNDTTVEKLGEILRDNPAGMLVQRDELVGLIASWDQEGREGDRAFYLEAWNGNASYDTDRIQRGSIHIPNLCASIFGGIQPDKLLAYLEQATHALQNDGMLQRFQILVYPDFQPWAYRDLAPNKVMRDKAFEVFDKLATIEPANFGAQVDSDNTKFPYFSFSPEAQEVFIQFSGKLHQQKIPAEENPIIQQHLTKYDKLFPALALILHLVECAAGGLRGAITKEAALRAEAWCNYLESHARRCYGLLADRDTRAAQALTYKISRGALQDGFTARDVSRKKWRSLTTTDIVEAALDMLEEKGWVIAQRISTVTGHSGRPTVRYYINPKAIKPNQSNAPPEGTHI